MALYVDLKDPLIKEKIQSLPPTKGYCIFVDVVGSTAVKDLTIGEWALLFHNTFVNVSCFLPRYTPPLKIIGDCCMFFIPELKMAEMRVSPLGLFIKLWNLSLNNPYWGTYLKISAVYCQQAYELTFSEGKDDVYGKDIDLTARLLQLADPQEIVMNEEFVKQIRDTYSRMSDKENWSLAEKIVGPWPQKIKGFDQAIPIYKLSST